VVLIDRLELDAQDGLCALTGETGAGKSILLDALGLALGARADTGLVRHGADQASVAARFEIAKGHPVLALLAEKDIAADGEVILRRTLGRDGRGKAFINDAPVPVQTLKDAGSMLVEIHGQFATQGLLDPATHRRALDDFAGLGKDVAALRGHWHEWRSAENLLAEALAGIESLRLQEEYLKYAVDELQKIAPQPGEETVLADKRARLKNIEKQQGAFGAAAEVIDGEAGILTLIGRAESAVARLGDDAAPVLSALKSARAEIEEASFQIERLKSGGADDDLEAIEERYFALRGLAKKHRCQCDDLPRVLDELSAKLRLITDQDAALADLQKKAREGKRKYMALAEAVSAKRASAAAKLAKAVQAELAPLKLGKASFHVDCAAQAESGWGPEGVDRVQFMVATNTGAPPAPMNKIASGGELSRFMLALKAVLAADGAAETLIFDEVDAGLGGATAAAVGERLAKLAKTYQVLVVTHSPQVAAVAQHHWHVAKTDQKGTVLTRIQPLTTAKDRQEEIARMLSGAKVTNEARAQAVRLLQGEDAA
jgi:DNA repair protein RecN (Recombination protein N)